MAPFVLVGMTQSHSKQSGSTWLVPPTQGWWPPGYISRRWDVHQAGLSSGVSTIDSWWRVSKISHYQHPSWVISLHTTAIWPLRSSSDLPTNYGKFTPRHSKCVGIHRRRSHHWQNTWLASIESYWSSQAYVGSRYVIALTQLFIHASRSKVVGTHNHSPWYSTCHWQSHSHSECTYLYWYSLAQIISRTSQFLCQIFAKPLYDIGSALLPSSEEGPLALGTSSRSSLH